MSLDAELLIWINQSWADPGLDFLFQWVSQRLWFSFPLLLGLLLYLWRRFRRDGVRLWLLLILAVGLGDILGNQLKAYFAMPRPCHDLFELLRPPGGGEPRQCDAAATGMPSNHALNFFAVAAFLAYAVRDGRLNLWLFSFATLVGLSRIYLAKHYPSQVVAGAAVGAAFGLVMVWTGLRAFAFGQRFLPRAVDSRCPKAASTKGPVTSPLPQRLLLPSGAAGASACPADSRWVWWPLLFSLLGMLLIWLNGWNQSLFLWLNRLGPLTADALWANLTLLGDTLVVFALFGLLLRQRPDLITPMLFTVLFTSLWVHGLKPLLDLTRPLGMLASEQVHLIGEALYRNAFPSGHTATAFAMAGLVILSRVNPLLAFAAFSLACLVGLSRAAVGVHWPLDILAGMFGGWLSAVLAVRLAQRWAWRPGRRFRLGLLGFLVGCSVALLITRDLGYPAAIPLQRAIGLICLIHLLRLLRDLWRKADGGFSG